MKKTQEEIEQENFNEGAWVGISFILFIWAMVYVIPRLWNLPGEWVDERIEQKSFFIKENCQKHISNE